MNDAIEATRGKVSGPNIKGASSDTVKLVLEISRMTGAIRYVGAIVDDKVRPAVDENGQQPTFAFWHHRDILITDNATTRDPARVVTRGACPSGYTLMVICGMQCCVPIS